MVPASLACSASAVWPGVTARVVGIRHGRSVAGAGLLPVGFRHCRACELGASPPDGVPVHTRTSPAMVEPGYLTSVLGRPVAGVLPPGRRGAAASSSPRPRRSVRQQGAWPIDRSIDLGQLKAPLVFFIGLRFP